MTQQANVEMGLSQLGKLHERVGEQQTWAWDDCGQRCDQYQSAKDTNKKIYPVWGRLNADYLKLQGDNRYGMKSSTGFAQFGGDVNVSKNAQDQSRRHTGVMFSYGWGSQDFYDQGRTVNGFISPDKFTGKSSTDMLSLGGYSTWYADNGSYVDLVGQVSWLRNKYSARTGVSTSQSGWGLGASVEVGRPWQLGESHWQIEPQAQLSYQMVHLNDIDDGIYRITGMSHDTLRGRIGARLAWNDRYKDQKRTKTFYVTANLLHDLTGGDSSVNVTSNQAPAGNPSTRYGESYGKTWGEVGVGTQWAFNKSTYMFVDVRYQRSLDGNKGALGGVQREGYNGRIGVRHSW